jgi:ribosomal protein S12 methylthiotransferase
MGCAKNVVDSEKLVAQLRLNAIEVVPTVEEADVAIVNTCGFIQSAKEESLETIFEQVKRKARGKLKRVYAMGCLTERYRSELEREIPEVDRLFGSDQAAAILRELGGRLRTELLGERVLSTPSHSAFLKVSEGCDNPCSFCAIPLMRGRHVSRPMEDILAEAADLAARGVRELVVIGQDTTAYGVDRSGTRTLARLLERLADIPGVAWVRLMYAFPAKFPLDVLDVLRDHPRICKYIDMPVQHSADTVLRSMRRGISGRALRELIATIRAQVPGIALRTTLITGYPNEGREEFEDLLKFVEEMRFERLGVFTYSEEDGTTAAPLGDPVPAQEKSRRRDAVMELQREMSDERNAGLVGTTQTVLIDRHEGGYAVGRTEADAPEVDNEVIVQGSDLPGAGTFSRIDIVEAYEYDLVGQVHDAS